MDPKKNGISRNTKILGFSSFLTDLSSEMIFPLLPFFLTAILGAPVFAVGLMESLSESVVALAAIASGFYADRTGKKKGIIVAGYSLSAAFKAFLVIVTTWQQVIGLRVLERIGKGMRDAPRDALIGMSESKDTLGKAFGFRKLLDNAGAVLGPFIAALLIALFFNSQHIDESYRFVFLIALIPAVLAVVALLFVKDIPSEKESPKIAFHNLLSNKKARNFIIVMAVLSLGNFSAMFFLLRANDFITLLLIPISYMIFNVSYTIFSMPSGIMADRLGPKKSLFFAMVLFIITLIGFAFYPSPAILFLMFVVLGWFMAIFETAPQVFLINNTSKNNYASVMGSYRGLTGLAALPANLMAGILWTIPLFSVPSTFVFSIATTLVAMVLLLVFVRD